MSKRFLIILLLITGIICGNALAKIDPATVTTGHVYLLDNVSGNQVPDDSANNNTGTIVGNPQVVDGLSGKALQFDGVDDGVNIPDSQYINVTSGPWQNRTIVAVFNCADVTKQQKQVVFEEGGRTRGLVIYVFDGQVYVGGWNRAEYNWNGAWLSTAINSNEWHAVALVIRDGTDAVEDNKFEMWMDGNLIDRAPGGQIYNHGNDNAIGYTNQNVVFHDDDGSGDNRDWFGGIVDEVWILNDALTASELSEIGPKPTKAKSPVPANDAIDIPRDVTLAWAPGKFANTHDVYFGTVFDDVNDASRTNPLDVLASQDQSATTYDPAGLLEFGQTYYWRVDEVNGPPDFTVYPGDVWQFTAEPLAYPIAGTSITATASSQFNENTKPENTINGSGLDADDLHSTEETAIWLSGVGAPQPSWIQYEFDRVYKLHQMWVWNFNQVIESTIGFGVKDATIEYSSDGVTWATLGTTHEFARAPGLPGYAHNTTIDFGGVTAQYVKITANSNWGGIIPQYGLSEIRFFYIPIFAREPDPASGATDMAVDNVTLSWRAGREAASHDVYLSTNEQAVIDETISPVSVPADRSYTSHDTGELELGQTYYWKINEVNEAETPTTWQGDVWDFGTLAYLVVDDFEDYNDFEPDRIFDTWIDGWGVAENGSQVGYAEPPFAEQTIVQSGAQSMPLIYDNSTASYSEATVNVANLAIGRDWTKYGIKALTLWFYGDPNNSAGEQMYVKLNGSKVVYDGEVGDITKTRWQQWNIDLASFGVNLSNVTQLSIGLERSGVVGGTGVVYLDNIGLYPSRCIPEIIQPGADLNDDCVVNHLDLQVMVGDWLQTDSVVSTMAPSPAELMVHYKLDGNASDGSGNNNHGVEKQGPTYIAGKFDQAIHLDGSNDYVAIQNFHYDNASGLTAVTVAVWLRTSIANDQIIATFDRNEYWRLEINGNGGGPGQVGWDVYTSTGQVDYGSNRRVDDGQWHHVAGVFDNGTMTIYIDGTPEPSDTTGGATFGRGRAVRYGYLGVGSESTAFDVEPRTPADFFDGDLDEVYIYHRALTPAEIAYLADETPGDGQLYVPVPSIANLFNEEPPLSRSVNTKDFVLLADGWLDEQLWP